MTLEMGNSLTGYAKSCGLLSGDKPRRIGRNGWAQEGVREENKAHTWYSEKLPGLASGKFDYRFHAECWEDCELSVSDRVLCRTRHWLLWQSRTRRGNTLPLRSTLKMSCNQLLRLPNDTTHVDQFLLCFLFDSWLYYRVDNFLIIWNVGFP